MTCLIFPLRMRSQAWRLGRSSCDKPLSETPVKPLHRLAKSNLLDRGGMSSVLRTAESKEEH